MQFFHTNNIIYFGPLWWAATLYRNEGTAGHGDKAQGHGLMVISMEKGPLLI